MVELSERQRACARRLCAASEFMSVDLLAQVFGVSTRTIRADLKRIESYLRPYGATLARLSGRGVRLQGSPAAKDALVSSLEDAGILTSAERAAIAEMMLICRPVVTYMDVADYCGVSKQTAVSSFSGVDSFFSSRGLHVVREPGVGSRLKGPEENVRRCFFTLIGREGGYELLSSVVRREVFAFLEDAEDLVRAAEAVRKTSYVGGEELGLCVAFALYRVASGHPLGSDAVAGDVLQGDPEASLILETVEKVVPSPADASYITSLILAQHLGAEVSEASSAEDDEADAISRDLVAALNAIHEVNQDSLSRIIEGFTRHIRAAIYRARNGIKIQGEVPVKIISSIPLLYDFARRQLACIERDYEIEFDENEVAYIAMYLDAIYETSVREAVALNVLFVCSFGLASSSILMTRLSHILVDCNVFGPLSAEGAGEFLTRNDIDLIVSTSGFSYPDVPVLEVDPILSQASLDAVKQGISNASYQKLCSGFLSAYSLSGDSSRHYVRDLVDPTAVQVGVSCMRWHEAIRLAACPLLRYGLIDKHYVDQMVAAVENYGPYMVLTPGVAYVHAGVDDGIKRNCIAVLVLNEPIDFGPSGESKRIRVVVVLGIKDKEQSELLNLASIFERGESIRTFERCIDVESILALHD
ncbi:PTS sugar transporter subunit IIA [uncultured Parolsenella sp.]|uniref:BglG family transcription antiterminator n=1 Tax=uncultured Parolsenella sp. TaxID=2083008 RepID=UPI0025E20EC0|nr:PTS sugar transporter subunit IIA [uncultured Parolsenella sp.]